MGIASIRAVAERAGVSVGTVSNVLNRPDIVARSTRERVEQAIEELDYLLNSSARSLRAGRNPTIGLVVLDVTNPFFTEVARGAEDAASEASHAVVLCNSDESLPKETRYLRVLEEQRAAGLLITPVHHELAQLDWLRDRGMAVTLMDQHSSRPDLCSVAVDDHRGGELAARHLLEAGHRRFAFITGPIPQARLRREGMYQAVRNVGLDPEEVVLEIGVAALKVEEGSGAVERVLEIGASVTGVLCANDLLAVGFLKEMTRRGLRAPDDLALVGYDDILIASMVATPLTTIRQPKYELGFSAAKLLMEEITSPEEHEHLQIRFEPELVVRESSTSKLPSEGDSAKSTARA